MGVGHSVMWRFMGTGRATPKTVAKLSKALDGLDPPSADDALTEGAAHNTTLALRGLRDMLRLLLEIVTGQIEAEVARPLPPVVSRPQDKA